MSFFTVFRDNHPGNIEYHFGEQVENGDQPANEEEKDDIDDTVSTEELNEVFDGEDYGNETDPPKLKLL